MIRILTVITLLSVSQMYAYLDKTHLIWLVIQHLIVDLLSIVMKGLRGVCKQVCLGRYAEIQGCVLLEVIVCLLKASLLLFAFDITVSQMELKFTLRIQ